MPHDMPTPRLSEPSTPGRYEPPTPGRYDPSTPGRYDEAPTPRAGYPSAPTPGPISAPTPGSREGGYDRPDRSIGPSGYRNHLPTNGSYPMPPQHPYATAATPPAYYNGPNAGGYGSNSRRSRLEPYTRTLSRRSRVHKDPWLNRSHPTIGQNSISRSSLCEIPRLSHHSTVHDSTICMPRSHSTLLIASSTQSYFTTV